MLRAMFFLIAITAIATPTYGAMNLCAAGKDKCVSTKAAGILKCYSKSDKAGWSAADLAACIQKVKDKFYNPAEPTKGCFAKLEAKYPSACLTTNDATGLEAAVDAFTASAYCALHPGDNSVACSKVVFVTSAAFPTGNLNGLAGADASCQTLADAAGLAGTFKAWLSTVTFSAAARMTHTTHPYRLVDGTQIASNWSDLTDGTLAAPIDKTESGTTVAPRFVWTDTGSDGSGLAYDCLGWTASSTSYVGTVGQTDSTTAPWTDRASYSCDGSLFPAMVRSLYCVQQ
jgi:hypothetical protein